jgi:hypothetical protein
MAQPQ